MIRFSHGAATSVGRVRQVNEDSYLAVPPLFVVADGMGGHGSGNVASRIAIEEMTACVAAPPAVRRGRADRARARQPAHHRARRGEPDGHHGDRAGRPGDGRRRPPDGVQHRRLARLPARGQPPRAADRGSLGSAGAGPGRRHHQGAGADPPAQERRHPRPRQRRRPAPRSLAAARDQRRPVPDLLRRAVQRAAGRGHPRRCSPPATLSTRPRRWWRRPTTRAAATT